MRVTVLNTDERETLTERRSLEITAWADMSALNTMPRGELNVSAQVHSSDANGEQHVTITLANPGGHVAFFVRAEVTRGMDGEEILPITYDENYITIFPRETRTIDATFSGSSLKDQASALRVEGYNIAKRVFLIH